jgi:glycosyltransferase involved in cell wall biosynthesis
MSELHLISDPKVVVIIPALNEEAAISHVVRDVPELASKIVVVDNGSTDRTVERAQEAGAIVVQEPRKGYGYACLKGMEHARDEDLVVFLDGDYSDYPEEMALLIEPILSGEADLVIGSRLRGHREPGAMLPHAYLANVFFSLLLRILCGIKVTDLGPFRAIRKDQLVGLNLKEYTYGWTLEMMIKAARQDLRVVEVPVSYRKRLGHSKVSGSLWVSLKAGIKMFSTLRYCWG